jgi:hypothetical protein
MVNLANCDYLLIRGSCRLSPQPPFPYAKRTATRR